MRAVIVATCGLFFVLFLRVASAGEIIGAVVPPFPHGWEQDVGACVGKSLGLERICDYSIGILHKGERMLLYIGKAAPKTVSHKGRWQVIDELPHPVVAEDERLVLTQCQQDGKWDDTIVAVVKTTERQWHTSIQQAFRVNLTEGRFEQAPTKGVRCANEGWGL